jgi:di- and tripeptidase
MPPDAPIYPSRLTTSTDTDTSDYDNASSSVDADHGASDLTPSSSDSTAAPALIHRMKNQRSILALVVSSDRIFAGTQGGQILVYELDTYARVATIAGHRGSVLSLCLSDDEKLIFSGAGDRIINAWNTKDYTRVYSIFSDYDIGDIFCVAYSSQLQTVYLGSQNTSIQVWIHNSLIPYSNVSNSCSGMT